MIEFKCVDETAYAQAIEHLDLAIHYTQMPYYGQAISSMERQPDYLVWSEGDETKAVALIRYTPYRKFFRLANCVFGPVLDPSDQPLFRRVIRDLDQHCRARKRVIGLRLNPPYIVENYEDVTSIGANNDGEANDRILSEAGFDYIDRSCFDDPSIQVQYAYIKDITGMTIESFMKHLSSRVRSGILRSLRNGIQVRFLSPDELKAADEMQAATIDRTGAMSVNLARFGRIKSFAPEDVLFPYAYLDCDQSITVLDEELRELEAELAELDRRYQAGKIGSKYAGSAKELNSRIDSLKARKLSIEELRAEEGDMIPMAYSVFMIGKNNIIHLNGGGYDRFFKYNPMFAIHYEMIKIACERDCRTYNFFGCSGNVTEDAVDYHVLQFKRNFDGEMIKYSGTWEKAYSFLYR